MEPLWGILMLVVINYQSQQQKLKYQVGSRKREKKIFSYNIYNNNKFDIVSTKTLTEC